MNRETSIHSSDTLVVVDRSARRRRMVIIGAIAALALLVIGIAVIMGRSGDKAQPAPAGGQAAGTDADGHGHRPRPSQVGRVDHRQRPARRQAATSRSESPARAAASSACWSMPASWVRAGQVLAIIDRSVQSQQAAQQAAQIEAARADAALAQTNYERALALKGRGFVSKAEIDSKKAARDAANAQVRVAQAQLGATRAQIGQLNVVAPTAGLILARNVELGQIVSPGIGRAVPARRRRPDGDAGAARAAGPRQRPRRHARAGDSGRVRHAASPAASGRSRR